MPKWWQGRQGKQSQQCKHCPRQPRMNYNQQRESLSVLLCFFVFLPLHFTLFWKSVLLFSLFFAVSSQYVYIHQGFVFSAECQQRCLIQPTQQGSEMNIIGQRLFPIGGFIHSIKCIIDCFTPQVLYNTSLCFFAPSNVIVFTVTANSQGQFTITVYLQQTKDIYLTFLIYLLFNSYRRSL